jgi:hypothetical protein
MIRTIVVALLSSLLWLSWEVALLNVISAILPVSCSASSLPYISAILTILNESTQSGNMASDDLSRDEMRHQIDLRAKDIHAMVKAKEPLTDKDKLVMLFTYKLPYKDLAFPESLTPAEHNRLLQRPPPDEVTEIIRKVTNGARSTPEEVMDMALSNPEAMSDEELELNSKCFHDRESLSELILSMR